MLDALHPCGCGRKFASSFGADFIERSIELRSVCEERQYCVADVDCHGLSLLAVAVNVDAHLLKKLVICDATRHGHRVRCGLAARLGPNACQSFVALVEHEPEQLFGP